MQKGHVMTYPQCANQLVLYLQQHPLLKVKLPNKTTEYVYKSFDGIRITFEGVEPKDRVSFSLIGEISGKVEYNEDGFARTVGTMVSNYYYTGPKPWQGEKPEWVRRREEWDEIIGVLEDLEDKIEDEDTLLELTPLTLKANNGESANL